MSFVDTVQNFEKEAIINYGCTEITFFKVKTEYFMDFSGNICKTKVTAHNERRSLSEIIRFYHWCRETNIP